MISPDIVKKIIYHEKPAFLFIKHEELDGESIGYMINKMKNIVAVFSRNINFCSWINNKAYHKIYY